MRRFTSISVAFACLGVGLAHADALPLAGVKVEGTRLSLNTDGMPLTALLESVSRDAEIVFSVQGDASRVRVSDSFERLEIVPALRRVLSLHSNMLIDHGLNGAQRFIEIILLGPDSVTTLRAVQVVGTADGMTIGPGASAESLLADAVSSAPPAVRSAAAEALAYYVGDPDDRAGYAGPLLEQMLSDPDEEVRARALEILKDTADELPFAGLAQVAREDPSAARRIQALALLSERSEDGQSRMPLEIALNDRDPRVRRKARELMLDWHVGDLPD